MSDEMIERAERPGTLAFINQAFRNIDVTLSAEDILDISDALADHTRAVIEATTVKGDGLVENLGRLAKWCQAQDPLATIYLHAIEAADTITTLKGEIERRDAALIPMREALMDARAVLQHGSSQSARMLLGKIDAAIEDAPPKAIRDWWRPDPEDPFWMIEVRQGFDGAGSWLKNEETYLTTREPAKALRFPSRFAAECALRRLPSSENGKFEPTEHSWIARG